VCRNWQVGILAVMVRENEKKKSGGGNMHKNEAESSKAHARGGSRRADPRKKFVPLCRVCGSAHVGADNAQRREAPSGGGSGSMQGKMIVEGKIDPDPGWLRQYEEQTTSRSRWRIKSLRVSVG
jgi:hypothetical protein